MDMNQFLEQHPNISSFDVLCSFAEESYECRNPQEQDSLYQKYKPLYRDACEKEKQRPNVLR